MEIAFTSVFLLTLVVLAILHYFMRNSNKFRSLQRIPKPRLVALPFLGNALAFRGNREELFATFSKIILKKVASDGIEVSQIRIGPIPVIFIFSPVLAAEVLRSTKLTQKTYFYSFLHSWLGTGLLTGGGEKWKRRRRLIDPAFHSSILQDFLTVMNEQARKFITLQRDKAKSQEEFDIYKPITLLSLDIICETAMGKRLKTQFHQNTEYVEAVRSVTYAVQERQRSPWLWPEFIFKCSWTGRAYFKSLEVLHKFTRAVLRDRASTYSEDEYQGKKRLAFLDMLLKENQQANITSEGIEEEVDTFMFAGHDTTATAISWALHMIGHHAEVQQKLHNEVDQIFGADKEREATSEDLRKLTYLDLVIKECLRLFPSVPAVGRSIDRDCTLGDHGIPAGTECMILPYVIHRNENFWTEPSKFDPERFLPERSKGRHPFAFIPFSAGPRNCVGQRFAIMEEKVVLSHILRNYSIESTERSEDLGMLGDIVLRSKTGIRVRLRMRK